MCRVEAPLWYSCCLEFYPHQWSTPAPPILSFPLISYLCLYPPRQMKKVHSWSHHPTSPISSSFGGSSTSMTKISVPPPVVLPVLLLNRHPRAIFCISIFLRFHYDRYIFIRMQEYSLYSTLPRESNLHRFANTAWKWMKADVALFCSNSTTSGWLCHSVGRKPPSSDTTSVPRSVTASSPGYLILWL